MEEVTKVTIDIEAQEAKRTIADIRKELKQTKDEMSNLEGEEFLKAAKRAGELQHELQEINQAVRGASSDFGDMLGNITKAGAGISGAFQAAKGAMNLLGVESENVTEAIAKMQSVMALTQGLASIDEGIKAFNKLNTVIGINSKSLGTFKKALIGTGLGALVVVLGSIIANWNEFTEAIGLSEKQMNKFGEVAGGVMNVLTGSIKNITGAITKAVTGDFQGAFDQLKSGLDIKALYAEGVEKTITKREAEEEAKRQAIMDEAHAKWLKAQEEKEKAAEASLKAQTEAEKEANRAAREALDIRLEQNKRLEQTDAERLQNQIAIENERLSLMQHGSLEYEKQLTLIYNLNEKLKDTTGLDTQADAVDNLADSTENLLTKEELLADALNKTNQVGQAAFGALADTLASFAEMQDTTTKEGFEQQKKLQIASVTMNMLGGVLSAWTSAMNPANAWMTIWGQIAMGIAQTTATIAMGAAQIQKIKQTTFENAGNPSTNVHTPSLSSAAMSTATPVQYTQDIQGGNIESAIKDTRVYVTETDISDVQKRVNVAESESRF